MAFFNHATHSQASKSERLVLHNNGSLPKDFNQNYMNIAREILPRQWKKQKTNK